ncbi:hypothetical protein ACVNS2_24715 [Paenibacillus caseinilyticus]|uniref:Uncharacterized protein n=1 Tax=Paenibacillus mucilaginosus K02 TaxID=997761 RepID=I0BNC7_9BACL|nr:hypothetical protein [Paenibacillus mucilaginosus]AFH63874.1 hypothetical protein B2K_24840 [Paenibacillus mucilaginosus K02]
MDLTGHLEEPLPRLYPMLAGSVELDRGALAAGLRQKAAAHGALPW